uniref:Uncharacterized protein n=1 Tax=Salix viminalis TaxID=40686 RepID=A0A6N2NE52_SALVM
MDFTSCVVDDISNQDPIVMKSWKLMLSAPRIFAGANSDRNNANVVRATPMMKKIDASCMVGLRPYFEQVFEAIKLL